jgi:hypothetical protein
VCNTSNCYASGASAGPHAVTSITNTNAQLWGTPKTWGSGSADPLVWSARSTSWSYFNLDNLGSIAVVTDSGGTVSERLSYDAWGRRRNSDGTDASCGATGTTVTSSVTTRGYTGHEMLDQICAINANVTATAP